MNPVGIHFVQTPSRPMKRMSKAVALSVVTQSILPQPVRMESFRCASDPILII
jgi:hypothetical protein